MRLPCRPRLSAILAVLPVLWIPALAQTKARSIEVGAALTFIKTDTQSQINNTFGGSVLVGYNFTEKHGGELVLTSSSASEDKGPAVAVELRMIRLGYTYNAYPREKVVSFFRFGVGLWDQDVEEREGLSGVPERIQDDDTNVMVYSGGGVRFFLNSRLAVRASASIDLINSGPGIAESDVQATGDLGLVFLLGGREGGAPQKEEKAEDPAPEEKKPEEDKKPEEGGGEKQDPQ